MAGRDVLFISAAVFAFGILFLVSHYTLNIVLDKMIANPVMNTSSTAIQDLNAAKSLTNRFDYIILVTFIGLSLALIITGWFVGGNPIFMFLYFLVNVVAVILSAVFANVWEQVSQSTTFLSTLTSFPIANHLILYLPIYVTIVGFIGIVVMFAKPYVQQ